MNGSLITGNVHCSGSCASKYLCFHCICESFFCPILFISEILEEYRKWSRKKGKEGVERRKKNNCMTATVMIIGKILLSVMNI